MTPKVFERNYVELKREVTSGRYMPGQRLQARTLADALRTSTSPVNQAMRQLIGEQVLEYSMQDGFIVPRVTEKRLRDLLHWSAHIAVLSIENGAAIPEAPFSPESIGTDLIERTEAFFLRLAGMSQNSELAHAMANVNDRLRSIRPLEVDLFPDLSEEIDELLAAWNTRDKPRLHHVVTRYYERRVAAVSQLVGLSYRDPR